MAKLNRNITELLLMVYFLCLILFPIVSIVVFVVLTVLVFYSGGITRSLTRIKVDIGLKIFIGYYLLHVIGIFYSTNVQYGLNDLGTKLSFLIVPIVFCGLDLNERVFGRIKTAFISGSVLGLLVLIVLSAEKFMHSGDWKEFIYVKLTHFGHPTYLTIYFSLALLFIQELYFESKKIKAVTAFLLFLFLFTGILLLSARTSTIVAIISLSIFPLLISGERLERKERLRVHFRSVSLMLVLFFTFLHFNNRFLQVEETITSMETRSDVVAKVDPNSTNIRLNLWKNSTELIREHLLFGVGTGDIKEELVEKYRENNYEYGVRERISPHNQFLHTGVILGLIGMLLLAAYFFFPIRLAILKRDWLYFLFLMIILLNCMTESILEREAGILFFTAFNTCFYLRLIKVEGEDV